jgi:hypothetical protein
MQTYRGALIRLRDGAAGLIKELKEQITMPCRPLLPARGDESSEY